MRFSIVIPLYNKELEIGRAITSVLNQTWEEFELIIVDDGSTDKSFEKAKQFGDPRIKLIQQSNSGVSAARNKGIQKSLNEYIAFLDADDAWQPKFLEVIRNLIAEFPAAGAFGLAWQGLAKNNKIFISKFKSIPQPPWRGIVPSYFRVALEGEFLSASSVVIPKATFGKVGNFSTDTSMGEDKDLWERIALQYPIAYDSYVGATYFLNSTNRLCDKYFDQIRARDHVISSTIESRRPFFRMAQDAIAQSQVRQDILPDLKEYLIKYNIISAEIFIKYLKKRDVGRCILRNTNPKSRSLQRKKMILNVISRLPLPLIQWVMDINQYYRKMK